MVKHVLRWSKDRSLLFAATCTILGGERALPAHFSIDTVSACVLETRRCYQSTLNYLFT